MEKDTVALQKKIQNEIEQFQTAGKGKLSYHKCAISYYNYLNDFNI